MIDYQKLKEIRIPPEYYGYILEHDYPTIRRWTYTGRVPSDFGNPWVFQGTVGKVIRLWVEYNENVRRFFKENRGAVPIRLPDKNKAHYDYVRFWNGYVNLAWAIENQEILNSPGYHKTLVRLGL